MRQLLLLSVFALFSLVIQAQQALSRWKAQAARVTIIRDEFGVPHIYGKTDADAVFGLIYAQCEDDFARVERNYIEKLGRLAEVDGKDWIYQDLYTRLVLDSNEAKRDYAKAPAWLKQLLQAWSDGIHYYLHKHPNVKPALLQRFEPWYPLMWTDGSIGAISTGDIEPRDVEQLFSTSPARLTSQRQQVREPDLGSNGFAVSPVKSATGKAMLYINPHVTFYFRPEVHLVSEEGLNVYGAVTWGQFFIYQGFNAYCGWMHTSANVDVSDMYAEQIIRRQKGVMYRFEGKEMPVRVLPQRIAYKSTNGKVDTLVVESWFTHRGPIMAKRGNDHISVRAMNRSMDGLIQSWQRTKAKGLADFRKTMELRANTSNSTVYADRNGSIAFWHGNFVPIRDKRFNWNKALDGTKKITDWKGVHSLSEIVQVTNPSTGWIQHCNSTPFTISGTASPKRENYPSYMAPDGDNFRSVHAARLFQQSGKIDLEGLIQIGYSRKLLAFEVLIPALIKRYDDQRSLLENPYRDIQEAIDLLRGWNYEVDNASIATTLAIEWAERLPVGLRKVYIDAGDPDQLATNQRFAATASDSALLAPMRTAMQAIEKNWGSWRIPWGRINRFQRISNKFPQAFNDEAASEPIPFASGLWGMLPAYASRYVNNSKQRYGVSGNSFVAAVEFGPRIRAVGLLAGGNSGDPSSPHFKDQIKSYTEGRFRPIYFYREEVEQAAVRKYGLGSE